MEHFGSSKQEEGSLMQPLVDFEGLWKTHPSLPPGFSREQKQPKPEWMPGTPTKHWLPIDMDDLWKNHPSLPSRQQQEQPRRQQAEHLWMPGTPTKHGMPMDMDNLWKNHPSLPRWFATTPGTEKEKEMSTSPDTENVKEVGESGKVDYENGGGEEEEEERLILEELGYGSSNRSSTETPAEARIISFTELLRLAEPPLDHTLYNVPFFPDSQESIVLDHGSDLWTNAENMEAPFSNDDGQNENVQSNLLSAVESKENAGSINDEMACYGESIPLLQNKAMEGKASSSVESDKGGEKKNIGLNRKPRQQKPKKKKLRPKVIVDDDYRKNKMKMKMKMKKKKKKIPKPSSKWKSKSKPPKLIPKTPKPSTPKPLAGEAVEGTPTKSCKKGLNFNLGNLLAVEIYDHENANKTAHQYQLRPTDRLRKRRFDDMIDDLALGFLYNDHGHENEGIERENGKTLQVYQRRRRKDQCLTNNMAPGFPKIYKKKRSPRRRRRREAVLLFIRRKKRSTKCIPRRNFASLIAMPICDELPWKYFKLGEMQKNGIPSNPKAEKQAQATTPSKGKGLKKKRPLKIERKQGSIRGLKEDSIDSLIKKLEILSINDTNRYELVSSAKNNQVVSYKPKEFIAKVELDPVTMKMWNLLMVPQSRNEGVEEEMDREDMKRWDQERQVFRERVTAFLACMHVLQGDRRFQPWKGSVLDSVVGVFLTQNVSDKLSSSAFMTLAALFPLHSTSNDSECCIVEEDDDEVVEEGEDVATKSNPSELESSASCSVQSNEIAETENKYLNHSHERKRAKNNDKEDCSFDWDSLRRIYSNKRKKIRLRDAMDSLDWEAVRRANVHRVANAISTRGMNNVLAARIKDFLDRLVRDHGRLDLEWLRDFPPAKAKEYLLSIRGLGLKSVECVRLLTLHHHAFPVDTNVARITVRLGWVPLQPLPSDVHLHNLDLYPSMDTIQKYLWPRLCTLDQKTLYELHYQMITFGKVFCTKKNPYCLACPLRAECKHYLSSIATRLPFIKNGDGGQPNPPFQRDNQATKSNVRGIPNCMSTNLVADNPILPMTISILDDGLTNQDNEAFRSCEPIIEMPASPKQISRRIEVEERDIEDFCKEDYNEIPTIVLPHEEFEAYEQGYPTINQEYQASQAVVSVCPPTPARKLKYISRLRTEHYVYELPDSHRLLIERGMKREPCDPCPFLFAVWSPGETADSFEPPARRCNPMGSGELCKDETCSFCNATREQDSQTIRGTLLIPCRTAMRGSFPLNGTYFQVNEVFADDESSHNPIIVHRAEIWNLTRRMAYFGTSTTSIFRGLSLAEIHQCFWQGFICVRGFNRKSRAPKPLARRLHTIPSHIGKAIGKAKAEDDEE